MSNVQISVDGKVASRSDENGLFKLDRMRPTGTIKIQGQLDGYEFEEYSYSIHLNRLIGMGDTSTSLTLTPSK